MKHSAYGGSSASRYMACPGSVALSGQAPPEKPSPYAEEGTFAHAVAAAALESSKREINQWAGATFDFTDHGEAKQRVVTQDVVNAVNTYLDAVWAEFDLDPDSEIFVEESFTLDLEAAEPGEVHGSTDCLIYSPARKKLIDFDYKHGAGVAVDVEDSAQLKFYAMGAWQNHPEWDVREVELVIVQPRAFSAGGDGVKRWSLPMSEVIEFPYELNEAVAKCKRVEQAWSLGDSATRFSGGDHLWPALAPGDHCRWCPASTICTAREQEFVKAVREDFAGVDLIGIETVVPKVETLDFEHMGHIVAAYDRLGSWVQDLRKAMDEHLLSGGQITGWKVVESIGRAHWTTGEEEIAGYLELVHGVPEDELRPKSLVTITEAKKLLKTYVGKGEYAEAERDMILRFTIKESKGLTTAPESDRRAAISPIAAEFGSVQLGTE